MLCAVAIDVYLGSSYRMTGKFVFFSVNSTESSVFEFADAKLHHAASIMQLPPVETNESASFFCGTEFGSLRPPERSWPVLPAKNIRALVTPVVNMKVTAKTDQTKWEPIHATKRLSLPWLILAMIFVIPSAASA